MPPFPDYGAYAHALKTTQANSMRAQFRLRRYASSKRFRHLLRTCNSCVGTTSVPTYASLRRGQQFAHATGLIRSRDEAKRNRGSVINQPRFRCGCYDEQKESHNQVNITRRDTPTTAPVASNQRLVTHVCSGLKMPFVILGSTYEMRLVAESGMESLEADIFRASAAES